MHFKLCINNELWSIFLSIHIFFSIFLQLSLALTAITSDVVFKLEFQETFFIGKQCGAWIDEKIIIFCFVFTCIEIAFSLPRSLASRKNSMNYVFCAERNSISMFMLWFWWFFWSRELRTTNVHLECFKTLEMTSSVMAI